MMIYMQRTLERGLHICILENASIARLATAHLCCNCIQKDHFTDPSHVV